MDFQLNMRKCDVNNAMKGTHVCKVGLIAMSFMGAAVARERLVADFRPA